MSFWRKFSYALQATFQLHCHSEEISARLQITAIVFSYITSHPVDMGDYTGFLPDPITYKLCVTWDHVTYQSCKIASLAVLSGSYRRVSQLKLLSKLFWSTFL